MTKYNLSPKDYALLDAAKNAGLDIAYIATPSHSGPWIVLCVGTHNLDYFHGTRLVYSSSYDTWAPVE